MTTKLFVLEPANTAAKPVAYAKKGDMMKAGVALRKTGRSATAYQYTLPKMPKSDLLAAIHNHDFANAEEKLELRVFEAVKRPAKEPI